MKSFFRGLEMRRRESTIRDSLSTELMNCVKGIQFEFTRDSNSNAESESSLCTALEAIFMHGLKESLADKMSSVLGDPDQRPSPAFWNMLMVFSHSQMIKQICSLSQITNDVGRSRAWLRLTLNEGLLTSYLTMMSQDNSALFPYYKRYAFLRDLECLLRAIELLQGLGTFNFSLPVNSSMLNIWPNPPLLLAGLWTPPMKDVPVSMGTDIVKGIIEVVVDKEENTSISSFPSSSGRLYEEEEALKIILGTPIEGSPMHSRLMVDQASECRLSRSDMSDFTSDVDRTEKAPSLADQYDNTVGAVGENCENTGLKEDNSTLEEVNSTLESYHKIINTYNVDDNIQTTNLEEIIEKFKERSPSVQNEEGLSSTQAMQQSLVLEDFEVIEEGSLLHSVPEFKFLVQQLGKIMHEKGLIEQNFTCKGCQQLIGFSFSKAWVCSLTGCYYCTDCFKPIECPVPAKILHNWDFAPYPVSFKAASFLRDVQDFPLFDVRRINPRLYLFFPEMLSLQKLRLQLNYIRSYLFTCHDQTKERVKQLLWPREYLYEHVHLYAITDLMDIPTGKLEDVLKRAIKLSVDHILSCQLCSQRGYICEVCDDSRVIYPFYIDTTYRCPSCRSVFHLDCRREVCPKCDRIKKRKATADVSTS